jgi:hypothetical protein
MEVFSESQQKCEDFNDDEQNFLALKMTLCILEKSGKNPKISCDFNEPQDCLSKMSGDSWTTYITFRHHIDSLCFYYKTLLWEKSSEFLFGRILNSSIVILNGLAESSSMAERILKTQERLGTEVELNFNNSINKLQNFSEDIKSIKMMEKSLKKDISKIQDKVRRSENKLSDFSLFVEKKINFIYSFNSLFEYSNTHLQVDNFKFFLFLIVYIYLLTNFNSTHSLRMISFCSVILYFFFEKNLVAIFVNDLFYQYVVFYIVRMSYVILLLIVAIIKAYYYKCIDKENYVNLQGLKRDFQHLIMETPYWIKKYVLKLSDQNKAMVERFRKLNSAFSKGKGFEEELDE